MNLSDLLQYRAMGGKNSGGTTPDENAPGWHIVPLLVDNSVSYEVNIDGSKKHMWKCTNTLPKVVYGLSCVTFSTPDASLSFRSDSEEHMFVANSEFELCALVNGVDYLLISFSGEEAAQELGVEPGMYIEFAAQSGYCAVSYYVPSE